MHFDQSQEGEKTSERPSWMTIKANDNCKRRWSLFLECALDVRWLIAKEAPSWLKSYHTQQARVESFQEILLDLADFASQEQPENNFMVAVSRAWYNGSYLMTAKPIKTMEFTLSNDHVFNNHFYQQS